MISILTSRWGSSPRRTRCRSRIWRRPCSNGGSSRPLWPRKLRKRLCTTRLFRPSWNRYSTHRYTQGGKLLGKFSKNLLIKMQWNCIKGIPPSFKAQTIGLAPRKKAENLLDLPPGFSTCVHLRLDQSSGS